MMSERELWVRERVGESEFGALECRKGLNGCTIGCFFKKGVYEEDGAFVGQQVVME